jgi:hypothetical protein
LSTIDPVIARMMSKDPADRPASLGECIELLTRAQGDIPLGEAATIPAAANLMSPFAAQSHRRLETVPTVIDDGHSQPGSASIRVGAAGQTFLGSESDVMSPVARPSRVVPLIAAGALALVAAIGVVAFVKGSPKASVTAVNASATQAAPPPPTTPVVVAAPPAPSAPVIEDGKVRVDGAPAGAIVTADGRELGAAPGPFSLKNGSEAKLVVTAKGYKAKEVTVKAAPDLVVKVALDRQASPGAAKAPAGKGKGIHSDLEGFDPQ